MPEAKSGRKTPSARGTNQDRSDKLDRASQKLATRDALIASAQHLFAINGYHATGTHEIVAKAHVTRGALQHHFPKKEDLFLAVFEKVRREWIAEATQDTIGTENLWEKLRHHIRRFVHVATNPHVNRIVMVDGPAVIGWKTWRELQAADGLGIVTAAIEDGMRSGSIRVQNPEPLVYLIIALIEEGALLVTYSDDPSEAAGHVELALDTLLTNLI